MSQYLWRKLTTGQRMELLEWRKGRKAPWHSPPHLASEGTHHYHITAACFEHQPVIGNTPHRMESFSQNLLAELQRKCPRIFSWCVLPNHYHLLLASDDLPCLTRLLGRLHGRSSRTWNTEDSTPGRKVFFRTADRKIRSDSHFWATMNYIHNNPVHHGYVQKWDEWPWEARRITSPPPNQPMSAASGSLSPCSTMATDGMIQVSDRLARHAGGSPPDHRSTGVLGDDCTKCSLEGEMSGSERVNA